MARPKTDLKYEHLTIRCPEGLLDQWREAARRHDRSLNAEIVRALRQALAAVSEDETPRLPYRPRRVSAGAY